MATLWIPANHPCVSAQVVTDNKKKHSCLGNFHVEVLQSGKRKLHNILIPAYIRWDHTRAHLLGSFSLTLLPLTGRGDESWHLQTLVAEPSQAKLVCPNRLCTQGFHQYLMTCPRGSLWRICSTTTLINAPSLSQGLLTSNTSSILIFFSLPSEQA